MLLRHPVPQLCTCVCLNLGLNPFSLWPLRNQLCRSKVYCRTVGDRQGELHDLLDKLMAKAQKLTDSSVSLYYFRYGSVILTPTTRFLAFLCSSFLNNQF